MDLMGAGAPLTCKNLFFRRPASLVRHPVLRARPSKRRRRAFSVCPRVDANDVKPERERRRRVWRVGGAVGDQPIVDKTSRIFFTRRRPTPDRTGRARRLVLVLCSLQSQKKVSGPVSWFKDRRVLRSVQLPAALSWKCCSLDETVARAAAGSTCALLRSPRPPLRDGDVEV